MVRTKFIDPDYRKTPKTDRYCVRCQRDIKPETQARMVHVVESGISVLHPEDEKLYTPDAGDRGLQLIGMDCAAAIGMEWTTIQG